MKRLELGTVFEPATHYCEDYYGEGGGLEHLTPGGNWILYKGPTKRWDGFNLIADALRTVCPNGSGKLLDLGCSAGSFVEHAVAAGIDAYGVDLSVSAIESAQPSTRSRLFCADVTKPSSELQAMAPFDIVTSWDFWEHIFETDLDLLLKHTAQLLRPGGLFINVICTAASQAQEATFSKGVQFTPENSWLLCSGHVNVRRWQWWVEKFQAHGLQPRHDLAYQMQVHWQSIGFMSPAWSPRNLVVAQLGGSGDQGQWA